MKTVLELCDYCEELGNIPKTTKRKGAEKSFQLVADSLIEGEDIKVAFNGFLNMKSMTKNDGLYSCGMTDGRLIMGMKIAFNSDIKSVKLDKISSVSFESNKPFTNFGTITFSTVSEEFKITMDLKSAMAINGKIQAMV